MLLVRSLTKTSESASHCATKVVFSTVNMKDHDSCQATKPPRISGEALYFFGGEGGQLLWPGIDGQQKYLPEHSLSV